MPPIGSETKIVLPIPIYLARLARSFYFDVIRPCVHKDDVWMSTPPRDARCEYFARRVFEETNRYRTMVGLPTLQWDDKLAVAAWNHSRKMAVSRQFAHVLSDGLQLSDRTRRAGVRFIIATENIAWVERFGASVEELALETQVGWVNSPPHRANLENPRLTHLGVGVFCRLGRWYSTQNFAS